MGRPAQGLGPLVRRVRLQGLVGDASGDTDDSRAGSSGRSGMGRGAVPLYNLMEDAATAEIARAQVWQWITHEVKMTDGRTMSPEVYQLFKTEELKKLKDSSPVPNAFRYDDAVTILDSLVLKPEFTDFLTLIAYSYL